MEGMKGFCNLPSFVYPKQILRPGIRPSENFTALYWTSMNFHSGLPRKLNNLLKLLFLKKFSIYRYDWWMESSVVHRYFIPVYLFENSRFFFSLKLMLLLSYFTKHNLGSVYRFFFRQCNYFVPVEQRNRFVQL